MDYERKDSNYKARHGKEPQVLHPTLGSGKPSSLRKREQERLNRKSMIASKMKDM